MEKDEQQVPPRVHRGPVRRLRLVVEDGTWRVARATRVERMTIPTSWEPGDRELRDTSYVEVLGPDGEVVHRQRVRDPRDTSIEVVASGSFTRAETDRPIFLDVLVPDDRELDQVRLTAGGAVLPPADRKDGTYATASLGTAGDPDGTGAGTGPAPADDEEEDGHGNH